MTSARYRQLIAAAILSLFAVILIRTAWVSDDAYITLRTIDNFLHGYGLRWNVDERVQTYTHPAWLLLLSAAIAITRESYLTTMAAGAALSIVAVWLCLTKVAASSAQAWIGGLIFIGAKSFVDYSTSGLENPLVDVLLVALWIACANERARRRGLPVLIGCLLLITRQDLIWLVAPLVAVSALARPRPRFAAAIAGLTPLVLWELFSVIYYGFPVPNTAYAKIATGIPERQLIAHGWIYLADSATHDPLTIVTIVAATAVTLSISSPRFRAAGVGLVLHLAYVMWVGGDFMSGRFLTAPLVLAVLCLTSAPLALRRTVIVAASAAAIALSAAPAVPNIVSGRSFGFPADLTIVNGVADERNFYFQTTGLIRRYAMLTPPWPAQAALARQMVQAGQRVATRDQVGIFGFAAGPDLHVVDWLALGDPLLARLPCMRGWTIGHFRREIPAGYIDTLRSGELRIQDPGLREFYSDLILVTRGPLVSAARLRAILRLNLGWDQRLLDGYISQLQ